MKTKMLRLMFVSCLIAVMASSLNAQKIKWGEKITCSKSYNPQIIGQDDKYFYTASWIKSDFNIEKFEKGTNKQVFRQEIKLPKKQVSEHIVFADNKFVLFMSYYDKKSDETIIYANTYSGQTGAVIKQEEKLMSVPVEKKRRKGTVNVVVSDDSKRVLISHHAYYKKQKKYREKFLLLSSDLSKITQREDVIDNSEVRDYSTEGLAIDADGSFYYMKNYTNGRRNIVSYDAQKDYEKWEETIDINKLGLPLNSIIYNMSCSTNKKKDLVLVGYYSKDGKSLNGAFYLKIDNKSKEIVKLKVNEFDQKFKDQFLTSRDIKKSREAKVTTQFGRLHMYKKDDGGLVCVGEIFQYYYYQSRNSISEQYYYGDLITIGLSPNGELEWANRIPKAQTFRYSAQGPFIFSSVGFKFFLISSKPVDYMSYFGALSNDKFFIAYNDNPKNLQKKSDQDKLKLFKKPTRAVMTMYTIDLKTGVKEKSAFFDGKDYEVTVEPGTAYQTSQNSSLIVLGSRGKKFKYGMMDYKKIE